MIEFEHPLPAMYADGRKCGTYNNTELAIPGILTTKDVRLGEFLHKLRINLYAGRTLVFVANRVIMCNKNWIRDHVHVMKGIKYFEHDLSGFLDFILDTQRADGQFYEMIKQQDDGHWKFVDEDCRIFYPEDRLTLVRLELEADIEYLVVEGAMQYYQVTGDDVWLEKYLPRLEKGIDYLTSDVKRWDAAHGLVKRPFTIDTWDFTNDKNSGGDRRIHADEKMSIMHGDNSGTYQAMQQLAWFNRRLGRTEKAAQWEARAAELQKNMFRYLWNGHFFIHQLHLNHKGLDDQEANRLSLSCTYDINRGVTDLAQARLILEEYQARRKTTDKFSEWFTIDPAYHLFNKYKEGEYVNGAISPFTAGELAKAAFNNGYEAYGWDILERFIQLVERDHDVYFLYYPDSTPQPDGGPSAWGAAALLSAVDEGLAGIVNTDVAYRKIRFSPRFPVTPYTELRYFTGYEKTGSFVEVHYICKAEGLRYDVISPAEEISAHLLLPAGKHAKMLLVNNQPVPFKEVKVGNSEYVDYTATTQGKVSFELLFAEERTNEGSK